MQENINTFNEQSARYFRDRPRYPHEKIHYSIQSAEHTDFPTAHFDLVCVAQALHWFDPEVFLRRCGGP